MTALSITFVSFISSAVFALAVSLDAFAVSFAYGASGIRIPLLSAVIIAVVCSGSLGITLIFGAAIREWIPPIITRVVGFSILFILGGAKLLESSIKTLIRRKNDLSKKVSFSIFNLRFIINVYADPEKADADSSHVLSCVEAFSLAFALSMDGLAAGFGVGLMHFSIWLTILLTFALGLVLIIIGARVGKLIAKKISFDLSWISGVCLIGLALFILL